jgi:hypothetical protein
MEIKKDSWFEKLPLLIAAVSAIAITLSISRQIGFFGEAAPRLLSLLSLQDLLQNSLYYIPPALLSAMGPMIGSVIAATAATYTEPFDQKESRLVRGIRMVAGARFSRSGLISDFVVAALFYLFIAEWPYFFQFFIVFNVPRLLNFARDHLSGVPFHRELTAAAVMTTLFFLYGVAEGREPPVPPTYEVRLTNGVEQVRLLRTSSEYIIVRMADGRVSAINNSEVKQMTALKLPEARSVFTVPDIKLGDLWDWATGWLALPTAPTEPPRPGP